MSQVSDVSFQSALRQTGRHWGWTLTFGIISVLVGLAAIFTPGKTVLVLATLFGAQLIVAAVFLFVAAFAVPRESAWLRPVEAALAALAFVIGVYLVRHVTVSLAVLALVLGVYWMAHGITQLFVAIGHAELPSRMLMIAGGVISVLAGAFVVVYPQLSLLILTLALGIWLVIYGLLLIGSAFTTRAEAQRAPAQPSRLSPT